MSRPKHEDILKRQVLKLRQSQRWRATDDRDNLWERMVNLYRGKHYKTSSKEDRMLVNQAFATKNVIAPSVAINNPKFTVNARMPEAASQAIITEQVLNYLWRTHKYQDEFRLAVDDFLVIGHGWLKVGYKACKPKEIVKLPDSVDGSDEDEGVDSHDETVVQSESINTAYSADDRPFIERISPLDIYVDPDARHPKELTWIAQRVRRQTADVVVDKRYNATQRVKVASKMNVQRIDDETRSVDGVPTDSSVSYVDIWEFYDIRKGTVSTFCAEQEDGFLIAPAPIPYAFGHPFVMLRNYEVSDTFYPMGELEAIEELQHELNATRTQMMNHRKRYQRKTLYDKDAFDAAGIAALRSDEDNTLVPVNMSDANTDTLANVIGPMPQMGTPPDFYNQSDIISNDINNVSGVSDYMRGAQAEIRRTATEAAMIQDAQNARAADKLSRIESTLSQLGQRVVQLMQQFMTGEQVVRIVGMSQRPVWMKFDREYIQGEFDFEVEGGSTQPRNETFRRNSALQLMEAMVPFIEAGVVDPLAVARRVLQFGFDIKNPDEFFAVPPQAVGPDGQPLPPEAQQAAPPEGGAPTQQPGFAMQTEDEAVAESPIAGIPPELIAQLMGQTGLPQMG
jgi:hypothetical protein